MADRPIVFSGSMILALLAGTKSQTRRPLSRSWSVLGRSWRGKAWDAAWGALRWNEAESRGDCLAMPWCHPDDEPTPSEDCGIYRVYPPYAAGDRLWVREAWCLNGLISGGSERSPVGCLFRADGEHVIAEDGDGFALSERSPWRSPRFMPKWASRLTLTVTDVRVQRLGEISEEDAIAEGLTRVTKDGKLWKWGIPDRDGLPGTDNLGWPWVDWCADPRLAYRRLWESLHGAGSWAVNPWVVAYTFETRRGNIDAA